MAILVGVAVVAVVLVIAAVVIGREARRLAREERRSVFDFEDAVAWVCEHVGEDVAAELTPDDVRRILDWHLEFFRSRGVSSNGSGPHVEGPVIVGGVETVDYVLDRATAVGSPYTAAQVHAVVEAQMSYLTAIGAIGSSVAPDEPA
jgi:hypothetical protein